MTTNGQDGLSSVRALEILVSGVESQLKNCDCRIHGRRGFWFWLSDSFSSSSVYSTFRWPSVVLGFYCAVFFVLSFLETHDIFHLVQSIIVVTVLVLNIALVGWDTFKFHREVHEKAYILASQIRSLLEKPTDFSDREAWLSGKFFPQIYLPHSPCISLQLTYRDGKVVNLPTPLLVEGDIIKMCPGNPAPGRCENIEPVGHEPAGHITLEAGELFIPIVDQVPSDFTGARLRKTVSPTKFIMKESPFLKGALKESLQKSWKRPRSLFDKERHEIVRDYIERILIPIAVILLLVSSFSRFSLGSENNNLSWPEANHIFHRLALIVFPLVPFALPISWIILSALGVSKVIDLCPKRDEKMTLADASIDRVNKRNGKNFLDDIDTDVASDINEILPEIQHRSWIDIITSVRDLITGRNGVLWRSTNLSHAIGSITALCCVDKKGILSWPNPTADKVFFLANPDNKKSSMVSDLLSPSSNDEKGSETSVPSDDGERKSKRKKKADKSRLQTRPEVLDVTHDPHSAFSMQFDDPNWDRFLPNLKPLGLAVLLNTCNKSSFEEYTRFCDHIACESHHNEAAVPVVNKRCLCELSRQIGFSQNAVRDYEYLFQLNMFRHVRHEVIAHGKLLTLNIPRLKMPFPHVASSCVKEKITNTYQLFSQGTGDLVLDGCSDFWDGGDLRFLTNADRKRILDFYHRSSLSAYCMAFSYVPLTVCPNRRLLHGYTLELAPDSSHVFPTSSAEAATLRWTEGTDGRDSRQSRLSGHYLSNESLTIKEKEDRDVINNSPSREASEAESLATQMNNQVFIGMVTMQYQACPDFVQLVEQLEKACIRFVHFSKENELRSRVFSEKMGLESGWNCHISLHSTDPSVNHETTHHLRSSRSSLVEPSSHSHGSILRSQSAPCAVNLEASIVKFAGEERVTVPESRKSSSSSQTSSESTTESLQRKERLMNHNISPSPSRVTDSTATDPDGPGAATIAFDVLNRAKLPKGIENIRPHLENVDNVPLLVSLFTDCTPQTTCEMIGIMQEYGEVVCVLGSSANICNIATFLVANASIAIEPLYPEVCVTQSVIEGDENIAARLSSDFLSPTKLSQLLISLPCSLLLHRDDPLGLYRLIMEARNFMNNVRNSLQFLLCCSLSLSVVQLLSSLLYLPPLLTSGHVLWLVFFILPTLSFSLMGTPPDPHVMTIATGKNLNLCREHVLFFLFCYLIKFTPTMLLLIFLFFWTLSSFCTHNDSSKEGWSIFYEFRTECPQCITSSDLLVSQTFVVFLLVIYFVTISIGFVHRCHLFWQRNPMTNKWWFVTSITLVFCHLFFCLFEILSFVNDFSVISVIPLPVWIVAILWLLLLIPINTLVKRKEIKANNRQQRRARLEFNTKLGMNSPF